VPFRQGETRPPPGPIQDAQRAVSLIRSRAAEWGIDPHRIGIVGFSAGGHLAVQTAINFEKRTYTPIDAIDEASTRPNFAIGCYSGYLKENNKDEVPAYIKIPVTNTPPILLAHSSDDDQKRGGSNADNSVIAYLALQRAKVPVELHIYQTGDHDFAVRQDEKLLPRSWTELCVKWLRSFDLLK
jgi:acetyl esterase/lipase